MPLGRPLYEKTRDTRLADHDYSIRRLKRRTPPNPLPDASGQPDGAWLRTLGGVAVWDPTPAATEADLDLSDVTTQNVSITQHGFAPKAPNDTTKFLRGDGAWGTPSGMPKIFDQRLSPAGATIDTGAGGIPAGHGDLIVYMLLRSAANANTDQVSIRFNNDSGANYDTIRVQGTAATTTTASGIGATSIVETIHGNIGTSTVNYASVLRIEIPSYDQTDFFKIAWLGGTTIDAAASTNMFVSARGFGWRSLAAITRIAITTSSGSNLTTGSRMVVYGTQ